MQLKMPAYIALKVARYFDGRKGDKPILKTCDDIYIACEEEVDKLKQKDNTVTVARFMEACCMSAIRGTEATKGLKWWELPKG